MRKIILNSTISVIVLFVGLIIFFSTIGIKTNKFNNLFDQKVNQINIKDSIKAIALIRAYRINGHLIADLDPLGMMERL